MLVILTMNLYHLRYFLEAARAGNLGEAARNFRVTHSAVSQAIRSLERDLGVELLRHAKRRFELSDEGRLLVDKGRVLIADVERMKEEIHGATREPSGPLVIAAPQSLVGDSLANPLAAFKRKYPQVHVRVLTGAALHVKSLVAQGECEMAFLLDDLALESFAAKTVQSGEFVLVGRGAQARLEVDTPVLVTTAEKPEVLHLKKAFRARFKRDLRIEMEVLSWTLIKKLAGQNFGLGYVPRYVVAEELRRRTLKEVPHPGKPYRYDIKAIWPRHRQLPRNATIFLESLI